MQTKLNKESKRASGRVLFLVSGICLAKSLEKRLFLLHICNIMSLMKTRDAIEMLLEKLRSFSCHPLFIEELGGLLKRELKGKEAAFFKCLSTQLVNLENYGAAINKVDGHEVLKGFDGHFYSIHLRGNQFNVRLLVRIEDECAVFLTAFYERDGHAKTSYSKYTDEMQKRWDECREGGAYE